MGRKPRYQEYVELDNKKHAVDEKNKELYSLTKKINKLSNLEILDLYKENKELRTHIPSVMYHSNSARECWKTICTSLNDDEHYITLRTILTRSDNFINYPDSFKILKTILLHKNSFVRSIETWIPKTRNPIQQIHSLVKHVFAKYPTPSFLEKSFLESNISGMKMYIHMGSGQSLKNYSDFPFGMVISNNALKHLYTTPHDTDYFPALRRIQILNMGGDEYVFRALMRSGVLQNIARLGNDDFWMTVMNFFVVNTMIDPNKISEIIDFIYYMKFNEERTIDENRRYILIPPPHPNFSMRGRVPQTLIDQSDRWHYERNRLNRINNRNSRGGQLTDYKWTGYNINNGIFRRGKTDKYKITQLTSFFELRDEGQKMHHCVGSYGSSCSQKKCAIFSVKLLMEHMEIYDIATLEVRNDTIVQIRGKFNKKPNDTVMGVINEWSENEHLKISSYSS